MEVRPRHLIGWYRFLRHGGPDATQPCPGDFEGSIDSQRTTGNQQLTNKEKYIMGKGDKRTKRGKIFRGTCGASRPKKKKKNKKSK